MNPGIQVAMLAGVPKTVPEWWLHVRLPVVASPGPVLGESGLQPSPRLAVHLAAVAVICGSSCSAVEDVEVLLATPVVAA